MPEDPFDSDGECYYFKIIAKNISYVETINTIVPKIKLNFANTNVPYKFQALCKNCFCLL